MGIISKNKSNLLQNGSSNHRNVGWQLNVLQEIGVNTAHIASIRSLVMMPIITPNVAKYFDTNCDEKKKNLRMDAVLMMTTGDDQRLKCWLYKNDKIELLDECLLDIALPNALSAYYVHGSGILLAIAGQGIQVVALPFSRYLFKKIYYDQQMREEYRKKHANDQDKQ